MATNKRNEELSLDDSIKQNTKGQPILGVLEGPCADIINATRNGRRYKEELWEKVFENPIVKEYFNCGGIPGELGHPADRTETDMEKIAIMMPEPPKKNSKGQLTARFDILDTPNGRIAYTLAKYGYKLGVSSRGSGDTYIDADGNESVDADTYDFQAFDLVLLPAVQAARLKMVESLKENQSNFKTAICEALNRSTDDEKKIMTETLNNLKIDYLPEKVNNIESEQETNPVDNVEGTLVEDLQKALTKNQELESQILSLQEKLSVSYAKEAKMEEEVDKYKRAVEGLKSNVSNTKALESKITHLNEELTANKQTSTDKDSKIACLTESVEQSKNYNKQLNEQIKAKDKTISLLESKVRELRNQIDEANESSVEKERVLNEQLADLQKDLKIKTSNYSQKLNDSNLLVEKYKKIAKTAVDKYIDVQATKLGISSNEIKNKLSESYSFNDIDKACEALQEYKLNINSLPFEVDNKTIFKINESKDPIIPTRKQQEIEDDTFLFNLANNFMSK